MKTFTLFLVVLLVGFAPAPFPRTARRAESDDLQILQGKWVRDEDRTAIVVTKTHVQFPSASDAWLITLNPKVSPKQIDFVHYKTPNSVYLGIYRIEGDTLTYCVRATKNEAERPSEFNSDKGAWLQVYRRKRD